MEKNLRFLPIAAMGELEARSRMAKTRGGREDSPVVEIIRAANSSGNSGQRNMSIKFRRRDAGISVSIVIPVSIRGASPELAGENESGTFAVEEGERGRGGRPSRAGCIR